MKLLLALLLVSAPLLVGCIGGADDAASLDPAATTDEPQPPAPIELDLLLPGTPLDLTLDQPVSWIGPIIAYSWVVPLTPEPRCELMPEDPCLYYPIQVPEGTAELRAALDRPDHTDNIYLALIDPAGQIPSADGGAYTLDVRVEDPEPGAWTLRVDPQQVEDAVFRMRVQAISGDPASDPNAASGGSGPSGETDASEPVLPNLRPIPAFDFHFDMPVSQIGGSPSVPAGIVSTGCHPEEWATNGYEERCLRFSFGWGNAGTGVFDALIGESPPGSMTAPVTQRLHAADGSHEDLPAGTATVHKTHGHYHLDDVFHVEAFRVQDGELVPTHTAAKRGSCMGDYVYMDWTSWDQEPEDSAEGNCGGVIPWSGIRANPEADRVAQTPGWGDIYWWEIPENYIVFDGQDDGEYVLRGTVDAQDVFVETDETDNVGYTHMVVHDSAVEVLERGYGMDPWDPDKRTIEEPWAT